MCYNNIVCMEAFMENTQNISKDIFYNTFGTFFYFFCQWLLTILIVRLSGYEDAGILSLVISTTNIFYYIALFGVRNYQVSDIKKIYSDCDYINARILTIGLTSVLFLISIFFLGYEFKTLLCCFVYIFYKFGEAISDSYFGIFQRNNKYKKIAISYVLKGVMTLLMFIVSLAIFHDLSLTLLIMTVSYFVILIFYDKRYIRIGKQENKTLYRIKPLLMHCFPLMIYGLILPYLNFITRFVIEKEYGTELLGYYSSVTMVFVVLSTLMGSVFLSITPKISEYYYAKKIKQLKKVIAFVGAGVLLLGFAACIAGYILGDFIFSIIFGQGILAYMYLLIPTIIASVLLTYVSFFSSVLIAMGDNKSVLYANLISAIICTVSIIPFVAMFEMTGSLWSMSISLIGTLILLVIIFIRKLTYYTGSES